MVSKLLSSRVEFAYLFHFGIPDFWIFFFLKSGYPCVLSGYFYCFTSVLPSPVQRDSSDMKQLVLLSVFDTLSCMYDCMRCSTAGFMRHLFSNTSYNQGKNSNKFTYLNFMADDLRQKTTESLLTQGRSSTVAYLGFQKGGQYIPLPHSPLPSLPLPSRPFSSPSVTYSVPQTHS